MPDTEDTAVEAETEELDTEVEEAEEGSEEPEAEESSEEDGEEAQPSSTSRRETRVQTLANQLREEREARIRAEARAEERERQRTQPVADPHEAARVRAEKLALMDPTERQLFEQKETIDRMQRDQQFTQIQMADALDKSSYTSRAAVDPIYEKHSKRVEEVLAEMRRGGSNAPRETVLKYVIGDEAMKKPASTKQTASQKAAAAARVSSSKASPTSARSDTQGKRAGKGDSLADLTARLKDVEL